MAGVQIKINNRIFSISRVAIKNSWLKAKKKNNDNDSFQSQNRDHSFSTYAKCSEKLKFIFP